MDRTTSLCVNKKPLCYFITVKNKNYNQNGMKLDKKKPLKLKPCKLQRKQ